MAATVDTALSPDYVQDHIAYWITQGAVFRYNDRTGVGEIATIDPLYGVRDYTNGFADIAVADLGEGRHRVFIGTHDGQLYSYPADALGWEVVWPLPGPAPTPTPCSIPIDSRFGIELSRVENMGCPSAVADTVWMAIQEFERGLMLWREVPGQEPQGRVYVLQDPESWEAYPDTWAEGQPDRDPGLVPPQGLFQPIRGFGQVWREQLGGSDAEIGWAKEPEQGSAALVQPFTRGLLVRLGDEKIILLSNDGTWEQFEP
jgi:hypothetical protein